MTIRSPIRTLFHGGVGVAWLTLGAAALAAVPVEESTPAGGGVARPQLQSQPQSQPVAQQSIDSRDMDSGESTGRLSELFYQLQVLQQEVQELRGMMEEQNHRLDRLARDQQEQYLDLDRRMQALRNDGGAGGSPAGGRPAADDAFGSGGGDAVGGAAATAAVGGSERDAYTAAFELMKQRQFEQSAQAFQALINEYPNGAYTPNAFYWLGELYLAQDENEQARQAFAQVVNLYPDHQKVPDALYKLGVAYHRLGDLQRAREYLNRVRSEYPQSSAAGLAQTYLAEL